MMAKERVVSLDWLKCLAALLIVNSHLGVCYGKYASLATGGAIGNAIFFFCSGYALSLGRFDRFDNWFKRRIFRIYPSVFAKAFVTPVIAVLTSLLTTGSLSIEESVVGGAIYQFLNGGGWFLSAILRFYVVLYILRFVFKDRVKWSLYVLSFVAIALWFYLSGNNYVNVYEAASKFAWFIYFLVMLAGYCIGRGEIGCEKHSFGIGFWVICAITLICSYYGLLAMARRFELPIFDLVSMAPLLILMFVLLKLFDNNIFNTAWSEKWSWPFRFISKHCWEIYLAQLFHVFTYDNHFVVVFPFPLNIPMTFLAIFATAYVIKALSQLIIQLFSKEDFDWMKIIKTWN